MKINSITRLANVGIVQYVDDAGRPRTLQFDPKLSREEVLALLAPKSEPTEQTEETPVKTPKKSGGRKKAEK